MSAAGSSAPSGPRAYRSLRSGSVVPAGCAVPPLGAVFGLVNHLPAHLEHASSTVDQDQYVGRRHSGRSDDRGASVTHRRDTHQQIRRLTQADVEAIAGCVIEQMREVFRPRLWFGLADAAEVAHRLRVHESWVYAHAEELGAIRLGDGKKARLRFDLERVARAIGVTESEQGMRGPGRPRRHGLPAGVRLIEGRGS